MSMKQLLLSAAAASLLAGPVFADGGPTPEPAPPPPPAPPAEEPAPPPPPPPPAYEPSFYIEGEGGVAFSGDLEYGGDDFAMDTGHNYGGAIGYHLNPNWDIEFDVFRTQLGYDGFTTHLGAVSLMADVLYNFDTGWFADPYVGAGIGATRVRYDGEDEFPLMTGEEWKFGYQLMGGLMIDLTSGFGLFAEYRFHDVAGTADIAGLEVEYQSHNVSGGLQFTF